MVAVSLSGSLSQYFCNSSFNGVLSVNIIFPFLKVKSRNIGQVVLEKPAQRIFFSMVFLVREKAMRLKRNIVLTKDI